MTAMTMRAAVLLPSRPLHLSVPSPGVCLPCMPITVYPGKEGQSEHLGGHGQGLTAFAVL